MKSKLWLLLLIVAILGQVVITCLYDDFKHILPIFFVLVVMLIKFSGDMLSKYLFKFPGDQWIYFRDYLLHDFLVALGYYLIFALMWLVALVIMNPALMTKASDVSYNSGSVAFKILSSSLLPTLFYGYFHSKKIKVTKTSQKRLRKKL